MTSQQDFDPFETNPTQQRPIYIAQQIGNYDLVKLLGKGGMGEVYLARHSRFAGRLYAVKTVLQRHADSNGISRFNREIDVLAKLAHPNLLYAIDAGTHEGRLYLVTEFIDGMDLSHLVKIKGRLSVADACEIVRQMSLGLGAAHASKIVHRDIKPSNVMISRSGQVKVLDLGLALIHDDSAQSLTDFRTALGTPEYMPPEQWSGSHNVTSASDIYSIGCTLQFLLTGEPPFPAREYPTLPILMKAHLEGVPKDLKHLCPTADAVLADLVKRCLSKEADKRPLDCHEIQVILAPFCQQANLKLLATELLPPPEPGAHSSDVNPLMFANSNETLALPEKNDVWSRINEVESKLSLPLILLSLSFVLLSLASLTMAYYGPGTTETWARRFDRLQDRAVPVGTGFLIEAFRSILFLVSTSAICFFRFREPLRRFFSLNFNVPAVWIARIVILLLVCFFLKAEINRHWYPNESGAEMAEWGVARGIDTSAEKEIVPYRWYLTYSLCNYIFLFVGLIACPLLQFLLSDFIYLKKRLLVLSKNQKIARTSREKLALLHQFGFGCRELTARYVDVAGVLAIGIQYEFWIGRWTLTDDGFATEILAMVIVASVITFFLIICHIYSQGIEITAKSIDSHDFEQEHALSQMGLVWLLKSSLLNRLSGMAFLSLGLIMLIVLMNRNPFAETRSGDRADERRTGAAPPAFVSPCFNI